MSSRESILSAIKANQPARVDLPAPVEITSKEGDVQRFQTVLESIGGRVHFENNIQGVINSIQTIFPKALRIVSAVSSIDEYFISDYTGIDHHSLHDVDVAIIKAQFGVAENG